MTTYYTAEHDWIVIESGVATIGITDHAQSSLGDLVFVDLPPLGRVLAKGDMAAVVESVKAVSDVFSPLAGTVIEANEAVATDPSLINADAMGRGWLFRMQVEKGAQTTGLLSEGDYQVTLR